MDFKDARDELKPRLTDYVESITRRSKGAGMYVCPLPDCKSGEGRNHTGAFSIDKKNPTRWKCFSCGRGGDIFDLIGLMENIPDPLEQLKRAGNIYGIEVGNSTQGRTAKPVQNQPRNEQYTHMDIHTNTYTQEDTGNKSDYIPYYRECQKRLKDTDYLTKRGISEEVATRFILGYDPHYTNGTGGEEWKAIIIPTGNYSYAARNIDPAVTGHKRYRKTGNVVPFNVKALQTAKKPVFIVEGELDALSIIEVGGEAIGLGSTSNIDSFIKHFVKGKKPVQPLVIAFDNDEAGQQATEKMAAELEKLEVPFYRLDPYNGHKDANEALLADRDAFKAAVEQAEYIEDEAKQAERDEYLKTSAADHLQEFLDGIAASVNTPYIPTGISSLDSSLDGGLYEGLYIVGAISSLGKTTLVTQIADQIAQSGQDVLIFSLEMARAELMAKSISRHTLLEVLDKEGDTKDAKTTRGITTGARYEKYSQKEKDIIKKAVQDYGNYANHIFIHEGVGDIGTEQIRETIEKHKTLTGVTPVIVIDYLQILAPADVRATDKQNTDKAVLELKRISRDFKTPVIGISSFNRSSYNESVTMEAFKESGAIEYGSDVLIGLQFTGAGKKDFKPDEAKKQNPRAVELVILKNRNGRTGDRIELSYYPLFNYFTEE